MIVSLNCYLSKLKGIAVETDFCQAVTQLRTIYTMGHSRKDPHSPQRKFLPSGGGGETKLFLIIVNVLGHLKWVGGLTSNFLREGGMDVFWNDPMLLPNETITMN